MERMTTITQIKERERSGNGSDLTTYGSEIRLFSAATLKDSDFAKYNLLSVIDV